MGDSLSYLDNLLVLFTTSFVLKHIYFVHHRACWHLSLGMSNFYRFLVSLFQDV